MSIGCLVMRSVFNENADSMVEVAGVYDTAVGIARIDADLEPPIRSRSHLYVVIRKRTDRDIPGLRRPLAKTPERTPFTDVASQRHSYSRVCVRQNLRDDPQTDIAGLPSRMKIP